jgi:hypothetical protein
LEEGFNQYVHRYLHHEAAGTQSAPTPALAPARETRLHRVCFLL